MGAAGVDSAATAPPEAPHSIAYLFPITFCSGIVLISLGPVLDPIIRDLDVPLSQAGTLATGFAAGRILALSVLTSSPECLSSGSWWAHSLLWALPPPSQSWYR